MKGFNFGNSSDMKWLEKYLNERCSKWQKEKFFKPKDDNKTYFIVNKKSFKEYEFYLEKNSNGKLFLQKLNNAWRKRYNRRQNNLTSNKKQYSYILNDDFGYMLETLSGDHNQKDFLYLLVKNCYENKINKENEFYEFINKTNKELESFNEAQKITKSMKKLKPASS